MEGILPAEKFACLPTSNARCTAGGRPGWSEGRLATLALRPTVELLLHRQFDPQKYITDLQLLGLL
jgi:hypothetical protein